MDWVPQIVQSGCVLGMLPTFPPSSVVSWLPIDIAADAFIDVIFHSGTANSTYLNLIHPNPASWHDLFTEISQSRGNLSLVPYVQWYTALNDLSFKDPQAAKRVAAIRILDFFAAGTKEFPRDTKREAMGMGMMSTDSAKRICPSLATASPLSGEDVSKWMRYWKERGLFEL
ncbi:hypothetical protein VKT23_005948 [Stygiomarasmius scandens]|uniref:Uncharacterized protein n=1 Tax=Marasmiellus scandens TaxID=2682957 RepID=A0ABR1JPM5_9AGAR